MFWVIMSVSVLYDSINSNVKGLALLSTEDTN